jgi:hypothetical protein
VLNRIALSLMICSGLTGISAPVFAQDDSVLATFSTTVEKLAPQPVSTSATTTSTQVSPAATHYQVKIEKVKNHQKYALPLSNQSSSKAQSPSVSPKNSAPTARTSANTSAASAVSSAAASAVSSEGQSAFAKEKENTESTNGGTLAAIGNIEPVIVTDVGGPPRGTGPLADMILQSAPALGDYRSVSISPQAFKAFIQINHGAVHANPGEVLVFKGRWDKAEHLLDQCDIAYSDAPRSGLSEKLSHAAVAVVDCPGELKDDQLLALRTFVLSGGYLVSTDWALDNCIAKIFPGCLVWKGAYSNPETIDAVPVERNNPLLKGMPKMAPWRLDDKSEIVELGGRGSINVLVRSRALQKEDPNNLGILAATITIGDGKVLHMIGHFDNNDTKASNLILPDPAPGIKISLRQSLAINFIVEALKHHQAAN